MMRMPVELWRNEEGNSVIELALAAPILAALVIGMTDLSRAYSHKLGLEQAAQRAIEKAMQGDKKTTLYLTLRQEAATAASVPVSDVTVEYWLECNGVRQNTSPATMAADYEKVCNSTEVYARYVTVSINKNFDPLFKVNWPGAQSNGTYRVTGATGLRVQ